MSRETELAASWGGGGVWLETAVRLQREGRAFVLALVVGRRAPQSARLGDSALILTDGTLHGWIGGGCMRSVIIREALAALSEERPRLLRLNPAGEQEPHEDVRSYSVSCQGGGAVDVFLEPVFSPPELMILGRTPVAQALCRLAHPLGMRVRVADPLAVVESFTGAVEILIDLERVPARLESRSRVVVATLGEGDEDALETALSVQTTYVGLVASRKRGRALLERLRERGVSPERLARVKCPAGIDIGARTPAEIALSVLAEIVQGRPSAGRSLPFSSPIFGGTSSPPSESEAAIAPVWNGG